MVIPLKLYSQMKVGMWPDCHWKGRLLWNEKYQTEVCKEKVISLCEHVADCYSIIASSMIILEFKMIKTIQLFAMYEFCKKNACIMLTRSVFIVQVFYTDGESEDITLDKFDALIRNSSWRLQVLVILGYVPSVSTQNGFYSDKAKVYIIQFCGHCLIKV